MPAAQAPVDGEKRALDGLAPYRPGQVQEPLPVEGSRLCFAQHPWPPATGIGPGVNVQSRDHDRLTACQNFKNGKNRCVVVAPRASKETGWRRRAPARAAKANGSVKKLRKLMRDARIAMLTTWRTTAASAAGP